MDFKSLLKKCRAFLNEDSHLIPVIVILGETASGKTGLSIRLAKELNGEVISADSRQVYRGMDIGTEKITEKAMDGVPHHLIDIVEPDERFTMIDFKTLAEKAISEIYGRKRTPIICGGTGLYIRALLENYQIPKTDDTREIREQLEEDLKENDKEWLHAELKKVDPEAAAKIHPNAYPYVLRALEMYRATGKKKSEQAHKGEPKYAALKIGITWPREDLNIRLVKRIDQQLEKGLLKETKKLLEKYDPKIPSMRSLGYQEFVPYIRGEISLEEAKELDIKHTKNFAKRQRTWFNKEKDILWMKNFLT
jgi:tRNA dimethylallyltransferase